MYNFGGADAHSNYIGFGDINAMDGLGVFTFTATTSLNAGSAGVRSVFGKGDYSVGSSGWWVEINADEKLRLSIGDGAFNSSGIATAALSGVQHTAVVYSGANVYFYANGAANGSQAFAKTPTANAIAVKAGASAANFGAAVGLADIRVWNVALSADEIAAVYAGGVPQPASLIFWAPGWSDPGIELIQQATATKSGTVTISDLLMKTRAMPLFPGFDPLHYISYVYKQIDETVGLTEDIDYYLTQVRVVDESLGVLDHAGEGSGYCEPDGLITDTVTDGAKTTVWTKKFPPFTRKTTWTESS